MKTKTSNKTALQNVLMCQSVLIYSVTLRSTAKCTSWLSKYALRIIFCVKTISSGLLVYFVKFHERSGALSDARGLKSRILLIYYHHITQNLVTPQTMWLFALVIPYFSLSVGFINEWPPIPDSLWESANSVLLGHKEERLVISVLNRECLISNATASLLPT